MKRGSYWREIIQIKDASLRLLLNKSAHNAARTSSSEKYKCAK
jgi:hypothetical protein